MTESETHVAQGELQLAGENSEALISLTPEQLDTIAGGAPYGLVSTLFGVLRMLFGLL